MPSPEHGSSPEEMGLKPEDMEIQPEASREAGREAQEFAQRIASLEAQLYPGRRGREIFDTQIGDLAEIKNDEADQVDQYTALVREGKEGRSKNEKAWDQAGEKVLERIAQLEQRPARSPVEEAEYQDIKAYKAMIPTDVGALEDLAERKRKIVALSLVGESPYGSREDRAVFDKKAKEILGMNRIAVSPDDLTRFAQSQYSTRGAMYDAKARPIDVIRNLNLRSKKQDAVKYNYAMESLWNEFQSDTEAEKGGTM